MHVERAAHVDHGISHATSSGELGLGIAGVVIGAVVCTVGAVGCLAAIGMYGGLGLSAGQIVDDFTPASVTGKIISGLPTVRLGPDVKHAARAHSDTIVDCDGAPVAEGSSIVMLGPERRPMSRRGDRTECDGQIVEGLETVLVGGTPSAEGQQFSQPVPLALSALWLGLGFASFAQTAMKGVAWRTALSGAGLGAFAAGQTDVGRVIAAPNIGAFPASGSVVQKLYWLRNAGRTGASGIRLGSGLLN